jgi:hypothetical protein
MTDFPHSNEYTECPLCKQMSVFKNVDYKRRQFILSCVRCSYREVKPDTKAEIESWKWRWKDGMSLGLRRDV